jgi:hypothetical protein
VSNTDVSRVARATRVAKLVITALRVVLLALAVRSRLRQERAGEAGAAPDDRPLGDALREAMEGLNKHMEEAARRARAAQQRAAERAAQNQGD